MAEWLPWQKGLAKKPEVIILSRVTVLSRSDRDNSVTSSRRECAAVLMEFWEWVDDQAVDGVLEGIRIEDLPAIIPGTQIEFFRSMVEVGWLKETSRGLSIPNWERWLGHSAKSRLQAAQRQKVSRSLSRSKRDNSVTQALPENRREENSNTNTGNEKNGMQENDNLVSTNAHLAGPAKAIAKHYISSVKCPHPYRVQAAEAVIGCLKAGHTDEQLRAAAQNYALSCEREQTEPKVRQAAQTFYGHGTFEEFLKAPAVSDPAKENMDRLTRERQEWEAQEKHKGRKP